MIHSGIEHAILVYMKNKKHIYRKNLNKIMSQANSSDLIEGTKWYQEARLHCFSLSKKYGVSFRKCCAIMAALSPRSRWERNKLDAESLIAWQLGLIETPKFATYGGMVQKAVRIFHSKVDSIDMMLTLLNGPKISAFFMNIYQQDNSMVTVDTWIALASKGKYIAVKDRQNLKKSEFNEISEVITEIAEQYDLKPYQAQAVIWVIFKRQSEDALFNRIKVS